MVGSYVQPRVCVAEFVDSSFTDFFCNVWTLEENINCLWWCLIMTLLCAIFRYFWCLKGLDMISSNCPVSHNCLYIIRPRKIDDIEGVIQLLYNILLYRCAPIYLISLFLMGILIVSNILILKMIILHNFVHVKYITKINS